MTVFQNKKIKAFLEKKNQGRNNGGKFRFRQKSYGTETDTETETRFRSYTSPGLKV